MRKILPKAKEIGIDIPHNINAEKYQHGFNHAITGGQLTTPKQLKTSFRLGFRAGKIHARELERKNGILPFSRVGKIKARVIE